MDTIEALKAKMDDLRDRKADAIKTIHGWSIDLNDLLGRLEAFKEALKRARVEEEEPPKLTESEQDDMDRRPPYSPGGNAARRLRWCERELARLREGLSEQQCDEDDSVVDGFAGSATVAARFAREIQRHRALLKDGGGK